MKVPVNEPLLSADAKRNIEQAISSGFISSAGTFVKEFETAFARYIGRKYAVTTTNGTSALHLALIAHKIGKEDEVIVPAFSMGAVWLAVLQTGAKPVFVDCESDNFNIDPSLIEEKITKKTRAIIAVHTYGHPADMDAIQAVAKKHSILVIEDAAEAHGALYKGKLCGALSDTACFSFYANKLITTGEGGMVLTDDDEIAERAQSLKDLAHSKKKRFIHDEIGFNYRMTNLQAAIGLGELAHINEYVAKKRSMAAHYEKLLRDIPGISLPIEKEWAKSVYWMYAILLDEKKFGMNRDTLRTKLKDAGIDTRDFFYPPSEQPILKKIIDKEQYPVTERIGATGLYLPSGLAITNEQIEYVAKTVRSFASTK